MSRNRKNTWPRNAGAAIVALGSLLTAVEAPGQAQPAQESAPPEHGMNWIDPFLKGTFRGAATCQQCHAQPNETYKLAGAMDWCLLTEFSTWRAMDKHSFAYAVLEGPRGQKMGELLGKPGEPVNVAERAECLSCHALDAPPERIDQTFYSKADGVNCEVCHGPSGGNQGWFAPHSQSSWRLKTPQEKAEWNFIDLRDPAMKVRLCLSCHVGDAALGRVVTHPMYAAGHPPLPSIDVAAFVKNEPQHWRDQDNVPFWQMDAEQVRKATGGGDPTKYEAVKDALGIREGKLYEAEISLNSGILSLSEALELLAARADFDSARPDALNAWPELTLNPDLANDPRLKDPAKLPELLRSRWPEIAMTHMDCAACHHELQLPGWRPARGFLITPGRPLPRNWSSPIIDLAIDRYDSQAESAFLDARNRLYAAFNARPFGVPPLVQAAARELIGTTEGLREKVMAEATFDEAEGRRLLAALCDTALADVPDFDTARQIAASIGVIYRDRNVLTGDEPDAEIARILGAWERQLNLGRYPFSEERDELSLQVLEELRGQDLDMASFGVWTPKAVGPRGNVEEFFAASVGNPVLDFIRATAPQRLREAYVTGDFKSNLQAINNRGIQESLKIAGDYDPYVFQEQAREVRRRLPASE